MMFHVLVTKDLASNTMFQNAQFFYVHIFTLIKLLALGR